VSIGTQHERTVLKIIVAFEDEYRAYRETLAAAIRILRPDAEVMTIEPEKLSGVRKRFDPDIVICSRFKDEDSNDVRAWIELALDPTQSTKVRIDGQYSEVVNPTLDKLLVIIEEVAQLKRMGDL
jgi:hypothetical protein